MPTIEIVCVAQTEPLDFSDLPFAVLAENKLVSHRGLFQSDFDKLQGCIYHLGNPDLRNNNVFAFFAYELINDAIQENADEDYLKFDDEFVPHIKAMLNQLIAASPLGRITFNSDWQFGTRDVRRLAAISEQQFWQLRRLRVTL
ncbi:MAG TPA: hypothetical protein VK308_01040 [Pyrinomonadaceae bacterium]|nr:hypothetical protein [Pyrinomonadaceae bacterium]